MNYLDMTSARQSSLSLQLFYDVEFGTPMDLEKFSPCGE